MRRQSLLNSGAMLLGFLLNVTFNLHSQPYKWNHNILYGAAYYHEYHPYERLAEDIRLMKEAGISVVRLGESTWSLFEPEDGVFEFAWMDRIIDAMHKAGIKVILGTPTYSIPAWMAHKHPEVLAEYLNGTKANYGIRQNMDILNPTYRFYGERIIRKMMEHYAKHPAIIGYQLDNETTIYNAANRDLQVGFVDHLQRKFGSVDSLNKAWGLQYWGMSLKSWEEFPTRDGATNPGYKLEWERYTQQVVAGFLDWQAEIVREYKRPDQFITHDFMPLHPGQNFVSCSRKMDILSLNPYHDTQERLNAWDLCIGGDYTRSVKGSNYLITETNAQAIGWDSKTQHPPFDGQIRLAVYTHLATGANMVEYWHWHTLHYGQETYWKGVLGHDLEPNRVYREVTATARELTTIGGKLTNLKINNKVAILYSMDSRHALKYMPYKDGDGYMEVLRQAYISTFKKNVGIDFVFEEQADFSPYSLVIIPPLYIATDALLKKISDYVKNGGHVLMFFKSGFCNENSTVRWQRMPGLLKDACGFTYQEFSSIQSLSLKDDPFGVGKENNKVFSWTEFIEPTTARAVAWYDHPFFGKYPAITINAFGKGALTYVGTTPSAELMDKIVERELQTLGLLVLDPQWTYPLVLRKGMNAQGKNIDYYLNYSGNMLRFSLPSGGKDLLEGKAFQKGDMVELPAWDVLILEN